MKKTVQFLLVLLGNILLCTCTQYDLLTIPEVPIETVTPFNKMMVLGKKLNVPYKIENMRAAFHELTKTRSNNSTQLEPNALYVRFLPSNLEEYIYLAYNLNLPLYDYPLDREIITYGSYYHDPEIPENQITWQYTSVPYDFNFPENIRYEILEEGYIPGFTADNLTRNRAITPYDEELERTAIRLCGFGHLLDEEKDTRALKAVQPQGCFRFYNNLTNSLEGAQFILVKVNWMWNTSQTTTDRTGNYTIPRGFQFNPIYKLEFINGLYGFQVYENLLTLSPAIHDMQTHDNHGYSKDFYTNSEAWDWIAINNTAVNYYEECRYRNYALEPNNDIRIYCASAQSVSSAPMLSKINTTFDINSSALTNWLSGYLRLNPADMRTLMPDITVGTSSNLYRDIFTSLSHELAHASHFRQVGTEFWAEYISYILYCWNNGLENLYGNRTTPGNGVCGIGEIWGYFSGHRIIHMSYFSALYPNNNQYNGLYPTTASNWFRPEILWDIVENQLLTPRQIFTCMTVDIKSIDQLRNKLFITYPDIFLQIDNHFRDYGWGRPIITRQFI